MMVTIEGVVNFFDAYPPWAKLTMIAGLILVVGIALLVPRSVGSATPQSVTLKIHGVNGDAMPPDSKIRVTAIVNGKAYTYPSLAGVDWLLIGPIMSSQSFPISQNARYEVRFEMETMSSTAGPTARYVSQETALVTSVPHTSEYRLYPVKIDGAGVSRAAIPGSSIKYSIELIQ